MYLSMPSLILGGRNGSLRDCTNRYGTWMSEVGDNLEFVSLITVAAESTYDLSSS